MGADGCSKALDRWFKNKNQTNQKKKKRTFTSENKYFLYISVWLDVEVGFSFKQMLPWIFKYVYKCRLFFLQYNLYTNSYTHIM